MGNSLFEQLQKSGLVDKNKAQKARKSRYKDSKQKTRRGAPGPLDEAKQLARQAHADKVERDRQLNQQLKAQREDKAVAAQIRQLIEANAVRDRDGDIVYHFTDANVVRQLHVSEPVHKHLVAGRLAIVRLDAAYVLVPIPVADKIRQRDPRCIIRSGHDATPAQDAEPVGDDPYADYRIPDDLMW